MSQLVSAQAFRDSLERIVLLAYRLGYQNALGGSTTDDSGVIHSVYELSHIFTKMFDEHEGPCSLGYTHPIIGPLVAELETMVMVCHDLSINEPDDDLTAQCGPVMSCCGQHQENCFCE